MPQSITKGKAWQQNQGWEVTLLQKQGPSGHTAAEAGAAGHTAAE